MKKRTPQFGGTVHDNRKENHQYVATFTNLALAFFLLCFLPHLCEIFILLLIILFASLFSPHQQWKQHLFWETMCPRSLSQMDTGRKCGLKIKYPSSIANKGMGITVKGKKRDLRIRQAYEGVAIRNGASPNASRAHSLGSNSIFERWGAQQARSETQAREVLRSGVADKTI